jgi:hypothetical protein
VEIAKAINPAKDARETLRLKIIAIIAMLKDISIIRQSSIIINPIVEAIPLPPLNFK